MYVCPRVDHPVNGPVVTTGPVSRTPVVLNLRLSDSVSVLTLSLPVRPEPTRGPSLRYDWSRPDSCRRPGRRRDVGPERPSRRLVSVYDRTGVVDPSGWVGYEIPLVEGTTVSHPVGPGVRPHTTGTPLTSVYAQPPPTTLRRSLRLPRSSHTTRHSSTPGARPPQTSTPSPSGPRPSVRFISRSSPKKPPGPWIPSLPTHSGTQTGQDSEVNPDPKTPSSVAKLPHRPWSEGGVYHWEKDPRSNLLMLKRRQSLPRRVLVEGEVSAGTRGRESLTLLLGTRRGSPVDRVTDGPRTPTPRPRDETRKREPKSL